MTARIDALTEKEKETLRLILRGHDAKSSARELGISVHTVNERLREARRKLGVTSSREAARRLLAEEGETPERAGDKDLGGAPGAVPAADGTPPAGWRRARPGLAVLSIGVLVMSLIFAALLLPASPVSVTIHGPVTTTAAESETAGAARAAEAFLVMIDESRWADSYAATGAQFRKVNTLERWSEVSAEVRPPLGKVLTRDLVANESVPAPPSGYQLVKFRSTYANGAQQTEVLTLVREEGVWKVTGITFD